MLYTQAARPMTTVRNWSGRPGNSSGHAVSASATANELSGIVQIVASTAYDIEALEVTVQNTGVAAGYRDTMLDIYVGPSGQEQPVVSRLLVNGTSPWTTGTATAGTLYWFPVAIPKGSRISVAMRSHVTGFTAYVALHLYGGLGMEWCGSGVEAVGVDTNTPPATPYGTVITPGTTADGNLVILGTTTRRWGYIIPAVVGPNSGTWNGGHVSADIALNGTVMPNLSQFLFFENWNEFYGNVSRTGRYCDIPAGTEISMRLRHSGTAANTLCGVYGVY